MRQVCSNLVARAGSRWGGLGWLVFLCYLFLPMVAHAFWLWVPLLLVTLVWWTIDAVDQNIPGWKVPLGLLLLAGGLACLWMGRLTFFWAFTGAAWCLYWFKIRE